MSQTLAFAFELGLFVCLSSILLGTNKENTIAWLLLTILVIVQVCGNTYSVFKYISESETEYYQYLAKPLLFWIEEVSEETVQIIISWIMGAILPIVALLMTEMVSNTIKGEGYKEMPTEKKNSDETYLKEEEKETLPDSETEPDADKTVVSQETPKNERGFTAIGDMGRTKEDFQRK